MYRFEDMDERYHRQVILKNFGSAGQQKLLQAKVLVVGAGGLGCAALPYLVAAGVGTVGIVDDDVVSLNNLHRQTLYATADIGLPKVFRAKQKLQALNPGVQIQAYHERLTVHNALSIIEGYDIVIDGTDNFASRYMINDACVVLNKPLVYAAVSQFEGQVALFNVPVNGGCNYRDIFPQPPAEDEVQNCAEAGVLGVLPGIIGTMQAAEVIKWLTGIGSTLAGRLLTYNALQQSLFEIHVSPNDTGRMLMPADATAFMATKYEQLCGTVPDGIEIDSRRFNRRLQESNTIVIDVREFHEVPLVQQFKNIKVPLPQLRDKLDTINAGTILLFCQSGKRSAQAAKVLTEVFGANKKVYSLKGGIVQWLKENQQ
ncbi:MAG TPA: HesA/MoeB/ThiF family protein [Ferruginibacter sp.]|nr:HesA/MoeB/ThiF family protein [Ferruginibacter sp.]HMP21816.1 HesA/MoeB/ThiF family protein [Ferruginibacter sp.]